MSEQENDDREEAASTLSGSGSYFAMMCLLAPVFYVLSIGPVGWLAERGGLIPREPVRAFYFPVVWLHDHTFLEKPLEWYVALWGFR